MWSYVCMYSIVAWSGLGCPMPNPSLGFHSLCYSPALGYSTALACRFAWPVSWCWSRMSSLCYFGSGVRKIVAAHWRSLMGSSLKTQCSCLRTFRVTTWPIGQRLELFCMIFRLKIRTWLNCMSINYNWKICQWCVGGYGAWCYSCESVLEQAGQSSCSQTWLSGHTWLGGLSFKSILS